MYILGGVTIRDSMHNEVWTIPKKQMAHGIACVPMRSDRHLHHHAMETRWTFDPPQWLCDHPRAFIDRSWKTYMAHWTPIPQPR
jgi:hypothetical protein